MHTLQRGMGAVDNDGANQDGGIGGRVPLI